LIKLSSAKRYAKTLFEIAQEKGLLDKFSADLSTLKEICDKAEGFVHFLGNPAYEIKERKNTFLDIVKPQNIHEYVVNLVFLLIENGRIKLLPHMCKFYQDMEDISAGKIRAQMQVPSALEAGEIAGIKSSLEKALKKTVVLNSEINKDMIGGIWIKVGDVIYDGTVKRQLEILKDNLTKG
jgi:F-type H+-transporting ATPase subunit delta